MVRALRYNAPIMTRAQLLTAIHLARHVYLRQHVDGVDGWLQSSRPGARAFFRANMHALISGGKPLAQRSGPDLYIGDER